MKKLSGLLAIILLAVMCGCSKYANRTIEYPEIESANNAVLDITKISMTDSSTIIDFHAKYYPKYWIQLSEKPFIEADGQKYEMISAEGITPGDRYWIPESGEADFTLVFPPLPSSVKTINFSEDAESPWKIWGIDVTGKADYSKIHSEIPAALTKMSADGQMPEPVLAVDSTTLNVHLLSYRPEMGNKLEFLINTLTGQIKEDNYITIDEEGNGVAKILLYGTSELLVIGLNDMPLYGSLWVAPGDAVDLYIDCRQSGRQIMSMRKDKEYPKLPYMVDNGKYAAFNYYNNVEPVPSFFQYRSGKFGDYKMTGDEYVDFLIETFKAGKDSISRMELPELINETALYALEADMLGAALSAPEVARSNYYSTTGQSWGTEIPADAIKLQMTPDLYKRVATEIRNIDDLRLYMAPGVSQVYEFGGPISMKAFPNSILAEVVKYRSLMRKANLNQLDENDMATLRSLKNEFFVKGIERRAEEVRQDLQKADMTLIQTTPKVADDKVFDAIVAPHKGKVVMVDLWNTWCVPCRRALTENEPEKTGDLSSDDIVWIYIADETSPLPAYTKLLPGIKGLHYRVNADQIKAIRERFDVDGIPFYILVDRKGNATGRSDLRDHSLFKKTLLEEVAKK